MAPRRCNEAARRRARVTDKLVRAAGYAPNGDSAAPVASPPAAERMTPGGKRALALLGIARRAGRVALGTRAVGSAAGRGQVALLFVAGDASNNLWARLGAEALRAPRITVPGREALGRALGRPDVAVAAVTDQRLARRVLDEWHDLSRASGGSLGKTDRSEVRAEPEAVRDSR